MVLKRFIIFAMNKILSPTTRSEFEKLVGKTRNLDERVRLCAWHMTKVMLFLI
ncbi:MAG: hypothetical protein RLZZ293_45 [Pseudomonadota bacterium]|jgi:hypothetical protein